MDNLNVQVDKSNLVARYLLSKESMSQKKLHKLLYFAFVLYLTENNIDQYNINNILFNNSFEAWVHGPVLREIYPVYANFGYKDFFLDGKVEGLPEEVTEVCDEILEMYGHLSADMLEEMSHQDESWLDKRYGLSKFEPCSDTLELSSMFTSGVKRFYE